MKGYPLSLICSISLFLGSVAIDANAQAKSADAHVATAKAAATEPGLFDLTSTFNLLCAESRQRQLGAQRGGGQRAAQAAPREPERSEWYVEPVKVFALGNWIVPDEAVLPPSVKPLLPVMAELIALVPVAITVP